MYTAPTNSVRSNNDNTECVDLIRLSNWCVYILILFYFVWMEFSNQIHWLLPIVWLYSISNVNKFNILIELKEYPLYLWYYYNDLIFMRKIFRCVKMSCKRNKKPFLHWLSFDSQNLPFVDTIFILKLCSILSIC